MTAMIVILFLVGPLVIVPLGVRLIPCLGEGLPDQVMRGVRRSAFPSGLLLALAFALPTGPWAAALAVPWLLAAGFAALAAGIAALSTIREGRGRRPGPKVAVWAALAFLVVGAGNALADRAGVQPFGFSPTIVLLTAVHFTFAGFALTLVGVLADLARPSRHHAWALGALIVGMPITALGFLGVALAAWLGAISVALGGFGIGLAVIRAAGVLRTGRARALARLAGLTLLASMPLAVVYATGAWLRIAWLDVPTMARTHGVLNVLGFAIPAMVAWTIDRRTASLPVEKPPIRKGRRWTTGLVTGMVAGLGSLLAGPVAGAFGVAAMLAAAGPPPRDAAVGGALVGFGAVWLTLLMTAGARCGTDCVSPDLAPWLVIAAAAIALGSLLTFRARRLP